MKKLRLLFYGVLIFAGSAICLLSLQMGYGGAARPGSGFLPFWCGLLMALIALGVVIQEYRENKRVPAGKADIPQAIHPRKPLVILGAMVLYGLSFHPLGFFLANFLFLILVLRFVWQKGWRFNLAATLLIAFAFYGVFQALLDARLPLGALQGILFR